VIPLFHDFDGETVLIVGGGDVGLRKARRFAREAVVVVVSPAFADGFDELVSSSDPESNEPASGPGDPTSAGAIRLVRAAPGLDSVAGWVRRADPALVVAATDDGATNAAVEAAARDHGALINRTDRSGAREPESVVVPATIRDDPVAIAISTGGSSPALSRYLREQIETELAGAGAMAEMTAQLRERLKGADVAPQTRRDAVRAAVRDQTVWKSLQEGMVSCHQLADRLVRETIE
jgi:precorrin-2 dehydrogenase/sirohydrochlorin ferrochelatase